MKQGPDKGSIIELGESGQIPTEDPFAPKRKEGDSIIVGYEPANDMYFYTDRDRRSTLLVLGALGALDDMTVTQASAVWELRRANPALTRRDLYRSALRIGRDHVARR
jgi:hypothetical protein